MSATGTYAPSIWHEDWPNWSRAMSLIGGSSIPPESVVACRRSTGAPQFGQAGDEVSLTNLHHGHVYMSVGVVVDVHRLDANPAWTRHTGQVHTSPPEHVGLDLLLLHVHGDRGVLE